MRFRRFNHWRAKRGGYFWIPCPVCRQMFGGHERPNSSIPGDERHVSQLICPDCTRAGQGFRCECPLRGDYVCAHHRLVALRNRRPSTTKAER